MLSLLILLVTVCVVHAAIPCQAPTQLTFRAARHNYADTTFQRLYGEYDRDNQRVVLFEQSFNGSTRSGHEFLFLHRVDTAFDYDFRSQQCRRFPAGPFRPFEVPYNSNFEGAFQLGGPGEQVVVNRWSDRIPRQSRETWIGEFSLANCYPVSQFVLNQDDFNQTSITHFYNVVQGVANPNDFDVPQACFNATYLPEMPYEAKAARSTYYRKLSPWQQ